MATEFITNDENNIFIDNNSNISYKNVSDFSSIKNIYEFQIEKYIINVKWDDRSEVGTWLSLDNETENGFDIIINIRHKFFTPYQNQPEFLNVINQFAIALILAEKKAKSTTTDPKQLIDPFAIRTYMNQLLNKLSIEKE